MLGKTFFNLLAVHTAQGCISQVLITLVNFLIYLVSGISHMLQDGKHYVRIIPKRPTSMASGETDVCVHAQTQSILVDQS